MNALEMSRNYFFETALPAISKKFPELKDRIAAGLVGNGSECFGYDDELSRDHDWGVDFFIWLTDEDAHRADELRLLKSQLFVSSPPEFIRNQSVYGAEIGVMTSKAFYKSLTGLENGPEALGDWCSIPEENLAIATNGEVFCDGAGEFTATRDKLLGFLPEDLRRKRLSSKCMIMAQTGQYNMRRTYIRQDCVTMSITLARFTEAVIAALFLLNRRYRVYYKWAFRAMSGLPILGGAIARRLELLSQLDNTSETFLGSAEPIIENICVLLASEMRRQRLCGSTESFLAVIGEDIRNGIQSEALRALPAQYEI